MKTITSLVERHHSQLEAIAMQNYSLPKRLKKKIISTQNVLYKLRLEVREKSFEDSETEIHFFKHIKPKLFAELKLYCSQLSYLVEKPNSSVCAEISFIKSELKSLQKKKNRDINFYRYYKHTETILDTSFFIRGNNQLESFSPHSNQCLDPEFNTSHDMLAAEVLTYDLLTNFYKEELKRLQNKDEDCSKFSTQEKVSKLNWTASKTDLIELVYALKVSGAIDNGDANLNEMIAVFSDLFAVDLGNYYKTYSEIKNRTNNQTKFLDKLTKNLSLKMEMDEI